MSVCIDGAVLSSMLFNHLNSQGSQYGFLMGERIEHIEDRISDSQIHTSDVNAFIYISAFAPWPDHQSIYSRSGHIDDDWVKKMFKTSEQDLVGWYSFRHNSSPRPSLREITLHSNLTKSGKFDGLPEDLLFFLCTSSLSSSMSTHTCNHGFMHVVDGHFLKVPVSVMNLGDTTRKEYRVRSSATLSHSSTIQGSLYKLQNEFVKSGDSMEQITKMKSLSASMNKALKSVHSKVTESEAVLGMLETDVSLLRQRLSQMEQEEMNEVFEIAEKRRQEEDEARRKQDAKEDAEEDKQLEKLLIDLGITYSDENNVVQNTVVTVPPITAEDQSWVGDRNQVSFELMQPQPSLALDSYVQIENMNGIDSVAPSGASSVSKAETGISSEPQDQASSVKTDSTPKASDADKKVKPSDPFGFLDNELKLRKTTSIQDPSLTQASTKKNEKVTKMKPQDDAKKAAASKNFSDGMSKSKTSKMEMNKAQKSNTQMESGSNALGQHDVLMVDIGTKEATLSQSTVEDGNYTMSSSPVF